ncbi:MAG: LysE family translocator [Burkholderiaceae bacterium]|nr:LysE family translocator [Burkholderiaceae bacterium]
MLDAIHDWPLFIAAGLLLNLTPGADMALIASRAAAQGWRIGAAAALGVGAGCSVHVAAAAAGLGALLAGSPLAFTLLRWVGAAYLVWLGLGLLRSRPAAAVDGDGTAGQPTPSPQPWRRVFWQGFLTNALNPKVALFFLAFVPQFIHPVVAGQALPPLQSALAFVLLGAVFTVNGTLVNLGLAGLAAALSRGLGRHAAARRAGLWLNRGVGALFVALGLKLGLDGAR